MKNLCYNKGTKEKETNKKCFNQTKKERKNSNARIEKAERVRQSAVGIRRKKKLRKRRV